jgi:hypothetical protein
VQHPLIRLDQAAKCVAVSGAGSVEQCALAVGLVDECMPLYSYDPRDSRN